jgi:hypothetical protein
VKSRNSSFHVTVVSYDNNIINSSITSDRVLGLMDECLISSFDAQVQ